MKHKHLRAKLAFIVAGLIALYGCAATPAQPTTSSSTPIVRQARGRVRSIPPTRAFVSIAHEDIPGYMQAMTMDFETSRPEQLNGLEVGSVVEFSFHETNDHRLVLQTIRAAP